MSLRTPRLRGGLTPDPTRGAPIAGKPAPKAIEPAAAKLSTARCEMTAESLSPGARPPTDDRPIRGELFSTERLEAFAEALAAEHAVSRPSGAGARFSRASRRTAASCSRATGRSRTRSGKSARSRRPPSGWWTTSTSSRTSSARSVRTSRRASTASCPSSPAARSKGTRASMRSPGPSSSTPTAGSIPRRCAVSSAPTSASSPWRSASCGRSRSPLRLVLVENLRRLAVRIVERRRAREEADAISDALLGVGGQPPADARPILRELEGAAPVGPLRRPG